MPSRDQWAYSSSQELRHAARVQGRSVGRVGSDVPRSRNLRGHAADARDAVRRTAIPVQGTVEWHRSRRARGRDKPTPLNGPRQFRLASASASLGPLADLWFRTSFSPPSTSGPAEAHSSAATPLLSHARNTLTTELLLDSSSA